VRVLDRLSGGWWMLGCVYMCSRVSVMFPFSALLVLYIVKEYKYIHSIDERNALVQTNYKFSYW